MQLFESKQKSTARWIVLGLGMLLVLLLFLFTLDERNPSSFLLFLGSFHPLLVHFPIGILVVVLALELFPRSSDRFPNLERAIDLVLVLGVMSAVISASAGFLLSLEGGFEGRFIFWHKWLGILVAAGSTVALGLKWFSQTDSRVSSRLRRAYMGLLIGIVAAVIVTGHLGATLAHGSGYLTKHMPESFRTLLSISSHTGDDRGKIADIDAALIFEDLIQPIFQQRCVTCHNESKRRGGLRLDTVEGLLAGGESGPVFIAANPEDSEIVRRTTLPPDHEDRMPPEGNDPLSIGDTELIRWWIQEGASFEQTVAQVENIPSSVQTLFNRLAAPQGQKRTGLYALNIPPPDEKLVESLRQAGWNLRFIAADLPVLELDVSHRDEPVDAREFDKLRPLFQQITWLDLSYSRISPQVLSLVSKMPHLTRLYLQGTDVKDSDLAHLSDLDYLEYLNLYGTQISGAGLQHLVELQNLKKLYLWQTQVTDTAIEALKEKHPNLAVNSGRASMPIESIHGRAVSRDRN